MVFYCILLFLTFVVEIKRAGQPAFVDNTTTTHDFDSVRPFLLLFPGS